MATDELENFFRNLTVKADDIVKKTLRIEVYMCTIVSLFLGLACFGWLRRISGSQVVRIGLWAAYTTFYSTLVYCLGLMSSVPKANDLFAIWAVVVLYMLDSTDSITAYSLQDNEQVYRCLWETFSAVIYVGIVVANNALDSAQRTEIWVLFVACMARPCIKFSAFYLASKSSSWLAIATRIIADFMDRDDEEIDDGRRSTGAGSFDMRGCHYIVKGDDESAADLDDARFKYRLDVKDVKNVITVDRVWSSEGLSSPETEDKDGRLKDLCLSFALFKILRRRFANYDLGECKPGPARDKTWKFMSERLLGGDDFSRAFRVVEVELGFVFDFFYTKYAAMLEKGFPWWKSAAEVILLTYSILIAVKLDTGKFEGDLNGTSPSTTIDGAVAPAPDHNTNTGADAAIVGIIGVVVTRIVLYGWAVALLAQFYALLTSNWMKVWLLCKYIYLQKSPRTRSAIWKVVNLVRRLEFVPPWSNKIGQHCMFDNMSSSSLARLISKYIVGPKSSKIDLPEAVKKEVLTTLKEHGPILTDGIGSLRRNNVDDACKWSCKLTQTSITYNILVWHIATSLFMTDHLEGNNNDSRSPISDDNGCRAWPMLSCFFNKRSQAAAAGGDGKDHHEYRMMDVARVLSNYCAHLVASRPELLPENKYSTKLIYDTTRADLEELLKKKQFSKEKAIDTLKHMIGESDILKKASKLYQQLKREEVDRRTTSAKVLSDYWTEMVLYIAPCENPDTHIKTLTRGGELLSHLWALLIHAGVVAREDGHHTCDTSTPPDHHPV